jgi:ElaB/YqjD/DUF883 family membrane-anchored ribosome-binding protein
MMKDIEVKTAEEKVIQDRQALDDSVENAVQTTVTAVQNKIEEETRQVSEFIDVGEQKLKEKLAEADHFVHDISGQFDSALGQARDVVGRVRGRADEVIQQADEIAMKFENVISEIRKDFVQSSDELLGRCERVAQGARQSFTQATGQITEMMDKAEETMSRISDPAKFVSENPKLAISVLLFGGLFLGLFFRKAFLGEKSSEATVLHYAKNDHRLRKAA